LGFAENKFFLEEKEKIKLELTDEEDIKSCFKKDNLLIFKNRRC